MLISVLKPIGGPGSVGFFILCVVLALAIRFFGKAGRRLSRVWLITLVVGYLVLSLPITANYLADRLTSYRPLADLSQLQGVDTLVVLDGDNRRGRVREAKRVFDSAQPRRVIVSGDTWLLDAVIEAGIPADRVGHESQARNTWEQIETLRRIGSPQSIALVASQLQMPRITLIAGQDPLPVKLAPSALDAEPTSSGVGVLVPTYLALRKSRDAIYEHAAGAYYQRVRRR